MIRLLFSDALLNISLAFMRNTKSVAVILCICALAVHVAARAQAMGDSTEAVAIEVPADSVPAKKKKNFRITPFIAPSVSPEVGVMLTGGGLMSFSLDKSGNPDAQPSSVPFSFGYSSNGSAYLNAKPALFFKGDKNRLTGELWLKDMPDNYWGVGFENAREPSSPDSTTGYRRNWVQVNLKYSHRFGKSFFAGVIFDFNRTQATELNPVMAEDQYIKLFGTFIRNWSTGLLLQYDTRDFTVNAYKGLFLEASSNFYISEAFDQPTYQIIILDYRQYLTIGRPGRTLAWQVKSRIGLDRVPWTEMSPLGTPFDLRGYLWGRYRDMITLFGITEYRHMFMRKTPRKDGNMMSRFGFVTWLATGSLAQSYGEMKDWLPNAGVGLRFEIQKRMNARIDYGIGNDTSAFYISFNEAF
jgi:hypothetical protein